MQQAPENDRVAVDRSDGHSLAAAGPAVAPINWISSTEFRFDGLSFTCDAASYGNRATDKQRIIIAKDRSIIDALYEHLSPGKPQTMLEIGIAQGGSAFLHTSLFRLSKYVGLDLRHEDATVLALLKEKYGPNRVRLYYETSQTDKARIARICKEEFGGLCDVVIDDGSHQYDLSVQTLEAALPHVRPGGVYIIEDWSWAHWPGAQWQDRRTGYNIDKPALSNLVFELTMLCASRPDILSEGLIKKGFAAFRRGPSELDWQTFKVSEGYLTQGRSFVRL
jgi:cephalosporin hydroxylase